MYKYINVYIYIYMYIHICVCIHIYTHTHTYIYIYIWCNREHPCFTAVHQCATHTHTSARPSFGHASNLLDLLSTCLKASRWSIDFGPLESSMLIAHFAYSGAFASDRTVICLQVRNWFALQNRPTMVSCAGNESGIVAFRGVLPLNSSFSGFCWRKLFPGQLPHSIKGTWVLPDRVSCWCCCVVLPCELRALLRWTWEPRWDPPNLTGSRILKKWEKWCHL